MALSIIVVHLLSLSTSRDPVLEHTSAKEVPTFSLLNTHICKFLNRRRNNHHHHHHHNNNNNNNNLAMLICRILRSTIHKQQLGCKCVHNKVNHNLHSFNTPNTLHSTHLNINHLHRNILKCNKFINKSNGGNRYPPTCPLKNNVLHNPLHNHLLNLHNSNFIRVLRCHNQNHYPQRLKPTVFSHPLMTAGPY